MLRTGVSSPRRACSLRLSWRRSDSCPRHWPCRGAPFRIPLGPQAPPSVRGAGVGSRGGCRTIPLQRHMPPSPSAHQTVPEPISKRKTQAWLVWLSGLGAGLRTKGLQVLFPVRPHAWVACQVPSRAHTRGNCTLMSLSLSFSLLSALYKQTNKQEAQITEKCKFSFSSRSPSDNSNLLWLC